MDSTQQDKEPIYKVLEQQTQQLQQLQHVQEQVQQLQNQSQLLQQAIHTQTQPPSTPHNENQQLQNQSQLQSIHTQTQPLSTPHHENQQLQLQLPSTTCISPQHICYPVSYSLPMPQIQQPPLYSQLLPYQLLQAQQITQLQQENILLQQENARLQHHHHNEPQPLHVSHFPSYYPTFTAQQTNGLPCNFHHPM